jgi:hypothetical protein
MISDSASFPIGLRMVSEDITSQCAAVDLTDGRKDLRTSFGLGVLELVDTYDEMYLLAYGIHDRK